MKVIIDTDAGCDDAAAILLAVSLKVEILAITTVHGNTNAKQVAKNVMRILNLSNNLQIPVFHGCESSLLGENIHSSYYHGLDGLGDVSDLDEHPPYELLKTEHASLALIRYVKSYPKEITLICLGPLTNIATAFNLQPDFHKDLKNIVIMGGNYKGRGNITLGGEFNFLCDPEAAYAVLKQIGECQVTICPWELCLDNPLSWDWYEKYTNKVTKKSEFIRKIDIFGLSNDPEFKKNVGYICADQIAVCIAIEPKVVKQFTENYVTVELSKGHCRGQMIVDWKGKHLNEEGKSKLTIVTEINTELFAELLDKSVE